MTDKGREELNFERDREEIGHLLRDQAESEARRNVSRPPLGRVTGRGRTLARRRRAIGAGAFAIVTSVALLAGPSIADIVGSFGDGDERTAGSEAVTIDRAATFGIRAIAEAGLMDPLDDFYEYVGTEESDGGWLVRFASSTCSRTVTMETCRGNAGEDDLGNAVTDSHLVVRLADGTLHVADAVGPMDDDARTALLSYREPADSLEPHPEFAPIALVEPLSEEDSGPNMLEYRAAGFWAGPIPPNRLTFACHLRAFDDDGKVVHETSATAYESPAAEEARGGGLWISAIPADSGARSAEMACERFTGPGWEPAGDPIVHQHPSGRSAEIRGELVWPGRLVSGVDLRCEVTAFGDDGEVLGDRSLPMDGPWPPGDGPPYTEPLDVVVDVPSAQHVSSATFSCTVPSPAIVDEASDDEDDGDDDDDQDAAGPPEGSEPPEGPRQTVASGTLTGPEWGESEGREWALFAWSDDHWRCFTFAIGATDAGRQCTFDPESVPEHILGRGYMPASMFDGSVGILYGEVSSEVARIELVLSNGHKVEIEPLEPVEGIDARYYVAFVEPSESSRMIVYNDNDEVLQGDEDHDM